MAISIMGGIDGITVESDPTALKLTGGAISGDLTVAQKVGIGGVVPVGANNKLAVHNGNIVFTVGYGLSFGDGSTLFSSSGLALLSGATFTGKVNVAPTAGVAGINIGVGGTDTASTTAGDIWITTGGANLHYRDGLGAWRILNPQNTPNVIDCSSTNPALRVTQRSTGHTILVEDSNNPDSTPFVVTNNGQAVFGDLTPYSTATLTVKGGASIESGSYYVRVDSGGVGMYGQLVLANQTTAAHTNPFTSYANEVAVTINGTTRYIPYR